MITELEKEFFKCFGIERKRNDKVTLEAISGGVRSANLSQEPFYVYPQITDSILLQLLEVLLKFLYIGIKKGTDFYEIDIQGWIGTKGKTLQEAVLQMFINIAKTDFKEVVVTDIQEIFKEQK